MNKVDFFSSNSYIFLPYKKNFKVALAVNNKLVSQNSFKLYNPFSTKAIFLKGIYEFLFVKFNFCSKFFLIKKEKKSFIQYLETILDQPLIVSLYFATLKDKVVLQLQSSDYEVIGYLKYPLNSLGLKHIQNEIRAIEFLSKKINSIEPYILKNKYEGRDFLLIPELEGKIEPIDDSRLNHILNLFVTNKSYRLNKHPRVKGIQTALLKNNMSTYLSRVERIVNSSKENYKLVHEHGDFTPWNIIKVDNKLIPFDFEYFVEDGLEYLDLIKYYYQVGKLLKSKKEISLLDFVFENLDIVEKKELVELFLIKEIIRGKEENEHFEFEEELLIVLEKL